MSDSSKGYRFTFNGNTITAVYEVERGSVKFERMDSDETWSFDGANVIKTEWDDGRVRTTTYSDVNGDGLFFKTSKTYAGSDHDHDRDDDQGSWGDSAPNLGEKRYGEEGYRFDINANGVVTAVYEVEHGRLEAERMDWNETWTFDGLDVIQTETKFGKAETSVYTDANQDGVFQKDFELDVLTGANLRTLETYKLSLADGSSVTGDSAAEGDTISGMMELGRRGWKVDHIDANETLQVVKLNGDNLILRSKTQWNGEIDFSVFRDDDNDGLWTEIADGETRDAYVTLDGKVDLVGIVDAGLLQAADALIA
jgi:uncharacterized protein YkuJ